jgi:hypothetical protein
MTENYWDQALEGAQEESSGGGVIGRGRVSLGYFAFVQGFQGDDRDKCVFIPDNPGKAARAEARKAAQAFCAKNGAETKAARWCAITRIYRTDAVRANGEDVSWQNDRLETTPLWTLNQDGPSAGKAVREALIDHKVPGNKDFYGRFGWPPDPYKTSQGEAGMTDEDQEGNARYPRICVVQEVFASKTAAQEAVGSADAGDESTAAYPWADGWSQDDLIAMVNTFTQEKGEYDTFAELVEDEAGEDVGWGVKLLADVGEMDIGDIAKFTGLKKGAVRKALKS